MSATRTNAMRILESAGIDYIAHEYKAKGALDGVSVAGLIGVEPQRVFKTLITQNKERTPFVFVIPVAEELNLKKAAKAAGQKSLQMLPASNIFSVTGYVRGGCSPVGMKKQYAIFIHISAENSGKIVVSAGKIGAQVELAPSDLARATGAAFADVIFQN